MLSASVEGVSDYLASQYKDCIDMRKNPMETDVNMRADQREHRQKAAVPRLELRGKKEKRKERKKRKEHSAT